MIVTILKPRTRESGNTSGILPLRLSAVTTYFIVNARAVSCKSVIAWPELIYKAIEKLGEKIDKAKKTCEKLMILMEKTKIWKSASKIPSKHAWKKH